MPERFTIELDCPPGGIRPNDLIEGVLKDTPLELKDFETGTPFFGHQTWALVNYAKIMQFEANKPIFKERITSLYESGAIRYGSW